MKIYVACLITQGGHELWLCTSYTTKPFLNLTYASHITSFVRCKQNDITIFEFGTLAYKTGFLTS